MTTFARTVLCALLVSFTFSTQLVATERTILVDVVNLQIWNQLSPFLPAGTKLSSVKRPAKDQLKFIVDTSKRLGYRFTREATLEDETSWNGALKFLRDKGYKVAAPGRSNHQSGIAYDLAGPDLDAIVAGVQKAVDQRRITLLAGSSSALLKEPQNSCVHVEISGAVLFNDQFVNWPSVAGQAGWTEKLAQGPQ
ncbi:hypothetical protein ACQR1Y_23720 [Bradyrhizobium sp. HKCCYLRH3099]|uniref:hypothetical protein n=1 Tax=unclassified Bradyrhizobium TaxID=2631580 RepID=UPI003EBE5410